jgi:hypothetical protein
LLTATVLETPAPDRATLNVGGQQVQAETSLPLAKGQTLTLQVTSLGRQPVLELVGPAVEESVDPQQAALKLNLPRQAPMTPLVAAVDKLLAASPQVRAQLPTPVLTAIAQWAAKLPDAAQLSQPAALKQALKNSGLFLEARLAGNPDTTPSQDLKGSLLKLAAALVEQAANPAAAPVRPGQSATPTPAGNTAQPVARSEAVPLPSQNTAPTSSAPPAANAPVSPGHAPRADIASASVAGSTQQAAFNVKDLTQQVGAALARIEMHQLHNLAAGEQTQPLWVFELPVRDQHGLDLLQMRIEQRERRDAGRFQKTWSLTVSTDLAGLGPMHARVSLTGANEIHTTVWAEREATLQLVQSHRGWLQDQFMAAGLNSVELQCLAGRPAEGKMPQQGPLVDLQI